MQAVIPPVITGETTTQTIAKKEDVIKDEPKKIYKDIEIISVAREGDFIPILYGGNHRFDGKLFWKGTYNKVDNVIDFAAWFCKGEVSGLLRLWLNNKLVFKNDEITSEISLLKYCSGIKFLVGSKTQEAPNLITEFEQPDNVPGMRDLCFVLVREFKLFMFRNKIPKLEGLIAK